MNLCDGSANRAYEVGDRARPALAQEKGRGEEFRRIRPRDIQAPRVQFSGNGDTLVVVRLEGEYGGTAWTDGRVLPLNRQLEILRVVFEPADDQRSFSRPATNNSPSMSAPRSPVRRYGPLPSSASIAPKVCEVSSSRRQ